MFAMTLFRAHFLQLKKRLPTIFCFFNPFLLFLINCLDQFWAKFFMNCTSPTILFWPIFHNLSYNSHAFNPKVCFVRLSSLFLLLITPMLYFDYFLFLNKLLSRYYDSISLFLKKILRSFLAYYRFIVLSLFLFTCPVRFVLS